MLPADWDDSLAVKTSRNRQRLISDLIALVGTVVFGNSGGILPREHLEHLP